MVLYCGPFSRSTSDRRKIINQHYLICYGQTGKREKNYDLTVIKTL